jgi:hypothetical protein
MPVTRITVEPFEAAVATARDKVCVRTYTLSIVQAQSNNTAKQTASKQKEAAYVSINVWHMYIVWAGWR